MSTASNYTPQFPYDKHRGPHPGIVAMVFVTFFIISLILLPILTKGIGLPMPFAPLKQTQQQFLQLGNSLQYIAFLQFAAAVPLGIFTAAVTSRLSFLGVNVTGVSIALFGGIAASLLMLISGLCGWTLAQPGMADDVHTMRAVQLFGFTTGGVGHIAALGLLMAGISVPCMFGHYTPKWVAWLGIVLGAIAELSTLSLVVPLAMFLLPIARFGSFVWMVAVGFTLIKNRP